MTALRDGVQSVSGVMSGVISQPPQTVRTVPLGFEPLDSLLEGGVRRGDLMVLGGVPGVGKTIVALQWARNIAASGSNAVFACYEHDEEVLFGRLMMLEVGGLVEPGTSDRMVRRAMSDVQAGRLAFTDALRALPVLNEARRRISTYSDRLFVTRASGTHTGLRELDTMVAGLPQAPAALFVDYLQKVAVHEHRDDRVATVTEGLKDIAMARNVSVIAVAATDRRGLSTRRARTHHLRGSASVAYEADTVVMMNEKFSAVSKRHSAYDPARAETFKRQVVFSLEKNRAGLPAADVEFTKDFSHFRFDPRGGFVKERLVDDWLIAE